MKNLRSFHFFWITAVIILITGFRTILDEESVLDINTHDTYYVIHHSHIAFFLFAIYFKIGLIYFAYHKINLRLINSLSKIHTIITCLSLLFIILANKLNISFNNSSIPLIDDISLINIIISILFLVALLAQLIFIFNIIISTIKFYLTKNIRIRKPI
ncbi:cbb3-type cytochrome c oxidase subunit I [Pontimicrobium sp. IMCC45349]|uniref:cbb3-type cytochrome c oxidase subunit I n=1 Tax=Pontimicrobium sp. IMCC45349 TaxID=3391574 RepID=UPI0039A177AB